MPTLGLGRTEAEAFGEGLRNAPSPHLELEAALDHAAEAFAQSAPPELRRALRAFKARPWAPGILLVRGLPLDPELPPTPADGAPAREKKTFVSEAVLLGVAQSLGEPFGYRGLKAGAIVHDVCPVPGAELAESNEGSRAEFGLHTEVAFSPRRPDTVLLSCLRDDAEKQAMTLFANAREAVRTLDPAEVERLREDAFVTRAPASFKALHARGVMGPRHAVVSGPLESPALTANTQSTAGLTEAHELALRALKRALAAHTRAVRLAPGDLIAFDNRVWMHGRRPFLAHFDGRDRWAQRVYARTDPFEGRAAAANADHRVLEPL